MLAIRSILAPTDFSRHTEGALRYACSLAEHLGATLHLLHVLPEVVPVGPDPTLVPAYPPEYYVEAEEQARVALAHALDGSFGRAPAVEVAVRWGDTVNGVVGYARDQKVDLIVVATHGRTGLSHALLGSVAERIIREAPCPVLVLRDRTPA